MNSTKINGNVNKPIPELRGTLSGIKFPAFGEIKYDGEFTFIFYAKDKICTINKYNRLRTDFPALEEIRNNIKCKSACMLAELFYGEGKRNALYDLNSNKESDDLKLKIFDLIELDGNDITSKPLIDRKEALHDILKCHVLEAKVLNSKADAETYFKWTVDNGYEGAVIKSMDSRLITGPMSWVKLKMKDSSDYEVTSIDPNMERIEVVVKSVNSSTGDIVYKTVGVKAAVRYKRYIKIGDKVTIEHQGVLDSGSLRHPVLIPNKEWK